MRSICKAFHEHVLNVVPATPFDLCDYEHYFHYYEADLNKVSETECRLSILPALVKHPWMLALITDLDVYYPINVLDPNPLKELPAATKAVRALLTTPNNLPYARSVKIQGFRFINSSGVLKKMPAAIPNVTELIFSDCYNTGSFLYNNDLVKFYSSFPQTLTSVRIDFTEKISVKKVKTILKSIGHHLKRLEIFFSGQDYDKEYERDPDESRGRFEIIGTIHEHCKSLNSLTISSTKQYWKTYSEEIEEQLGQLEDNIGSDELTVTLSGNDFEDATEVYDNEGFSGLVGALIEEMDEDW